MSTVSLSFRPVTLVGGQCPCDEWHFQGIARELYSYLKLLAANHGGFIFASVDDLVRHTKQWRKGQKRASKPQIERLLRIFRALHLLGDYETRQIHGRSYNGWQFNPVHSFWATAHDGVCDFKFWAEYENKQRKYMGHQEDIVTSDGASDGNGDGGNDGTSDGDLRSSDGASDGLPTIALTSNRVVAVGLYEAKNP